MIRSNICFILGETYMLCCDGIPGSLFSTFQAWSVQYHIAWSVTACSCFPYSPPPPQTPPTECTLQWPHNCANRPIRRAACWDMHLRITVYLVNRGSSRVGEISTFASHRLFQNLCLRSWPVLNICSVRVVLSGPPGTLNHSVMHFLISQKKTKNKHVCQFIAAHGI